MKKFGLIVALALGLGCSLVGAKEQFNKAKAESLNCTNPCLVDTIKAADLIQVTGQNHFETEEDSFNSQYWLAAASSKFDVSTAMDYFIITGSNTPMDSMLSSPYCFYSKKDTGIIEKIQLNLTETPKYKTDGDATFEIYARETPYDGFGCFYTSNLIGTKITSLTLADFVDNSLEINFDGDFKGFGIKVVGYNKRIVLSSIVATWCNATLDESIEANYGDDAKNIKCTTWGNISYSFETADPLVYKIVNNQLVPTGGGYAQLIIVVDGHKILVDGVLIHENIQPINVLSTATGTGDGEFCWQVVENISQLKSGDLITFAYFSENEEEGPTVYTPTSSFMEGITWFGPNSSGFEEHHEIEGLFKFIGSQPVPMTASQGDDGYWRIYFNDNNGTNILGAQFDNLGVLRLSIGLNNYDWIINIENDGLVTLMNTKSTTRIVQFDPEDHSFGMGDIGDFSQFKLLRYVGNNSVSFSINDTINNNSLALKFAHQFLNSLENVCSPDGAGNAAIEKAINEIFESEAFTDLRGVSLDMLKYASAKEDGDTIQQAVSLYDYLVTRYGIDDVLNRGITPINSGMIKLSDTEASTISIAIIMSAMTLIGPSLLFLKKKKFVK